MLHSPRCPPTTSTPPSLPSTSAPTRPTPPPARTKPAACWPSGGSPRCATATSSRKSTASCPTAQRPNGSPELLLLLPDRLLVHVQFGEPLRLPAGVFGAHPAV